jgi:hypothetical protein
MEMRMPYGSAVFTSLSALETALSSVVICTRSATKIKIATREPPSFARKLHEFPRDISAEYQA